MRDSLLYCTSNALARMLRVLLRKRNRDVNALGVSKCFVITFYKYSLPMAQIQLIIQTSNITIKCFHTIARDRLPYIKLHSLQ